LSNLLLTFAPESFNQSKKSSIMKKFFALMAIAGFLSACNNDSSSSTSTDSMSKMSVDSNKMESNTADSIRMADTTTHMSPMDSMNKKDSLKKKDKAKMKK
jgi:uncharacterized lipoprotein YajG